MRITMKYSRSWEWLGYTSEKRLAMVMRSCVCLCVCVCVCQRFRSVQPLQPNPRAPLWMPCLLANVLPFCYGKFAFWPRANMFHFPNTIKRLADAWNAWSLSPFFFGPRKSGDSRLAPETSRLIAKCHRCYA